MGFPLMEPKSIAFYTAVALSILAVLGATTFPTLEQAQQPMDDDDDVAAEAEAENEVIDETDETEAATEPEEEPEEKPEEKPKSNSDNSAASQNLGLSPSSGVATCGEIVTEDVTLTSDLECDPGDGLIVAASGITINLNGYSISSSDEAGSEDPSMDYDGSSGILVANVDDVDFNGLGEISGFDTAVTVLGSLGVKIADLQLAN